MPKAYTVTVTLKVVADSFEEALEVASTAIDSARLLEQDGITDVEYPDGIDDDHYDEEVDYDDYGEFEDDSELEEY
jgi:hypothetical protein